MPFIKAFIKCVAIASCATFLFLPHFDVICDLLLNRRTATWNLFVKWKRDFQPISACIFLWLFSKFISLFSSKDQVWSFNARQKFYVLLQKLMNRILLSCTYINGLVKVVCEKKLQKIAILNAKNPFIYKSVKPEVDRKTTSGFSFFEVFSL